MVSVILNKGGMPHIYHFPIPAVRFSHHDTQQFPDEIGGRFKDDSRTIEDN